MNKIDIINTFPHDTRWEDFINWVYNKKKSDSWYKTTKVHCIVSVYLNETCWCGSKHHLSTTIKIWHRKSPKDLTKKQSQLTRIVSEILAEERKQYMSSFSPVTYNRTEFIKALKLGIKQLREKGIL